MQQVLVISGGDTFNSYEQYLHFLKTFPLDLERLKPYISWKARLPERLGEGFEVFQPKMPNVTNAQYSEWSLWISRILPLLSDNLIIIGHSLGGVFLAKYLSENQSPKSIKAAILLAAPAKDLEDEPLASFQLPSSLEKFAEQAPNIYLLHSTDDKVVPFDHAQEYQRLLPQAKLMEFSNKGHFNTEEFPELAELIRSL